MRSNIPVIAPIIEKTAATLAIHLVLYGRQEFGTSALSLGKNFVTVGGVVVECDGARTPLSVGFRQFENRITDLKLGMADRTGAGFVLHESLSSKRGLNEGEKSGGVLDAEAGVQILEERRAIAGASGVRGDEPVIADGILDASFAVAVVHLPGRVERLGAGLDGTLVEGVDIADIEVETGEERLLLRATNVTHLEHGVAEFDSSVGNAATRRLCADSFFRVEGGLQEVEETRDTENDEIGSDASEAGGDGRERLGHVSSLFWLTRDARKSKPRSIGMSACATSAELARGQIMARGGK